MKRLVVPAVVLVFLGALPGTQDAVAQTVHYVDNIRTCDGLLPCYTAIMDAVNAAAPSDFNIGAGMARLDTAAAFVKTKMPLGQGHTLSDEDAYDVAAYFTRQPRPDFAGKNQDWPKGGKPADARY